MHLYTCIVASHIGTWVEQEERGGEAEPEDGVCEPPEGVGDELELSPEAVASD